MGVRKLMDLIFSPIEMYWLDHMLPGEDRVKREDEQVRKHMNIALFVTWSYVDVATTGCARW